MCQSIWPWNSGEVLMYLLPEMRVKEAIKEYVERMSF
jgi:hypothetical protein